MAICLNSGIHMIIQIITYILLPLIVAYITTVMTKREEVELDAQGQLLEHRVQAYIIQYLRPLRIFQQRQQIQQLIAHSVALAIASKISKKRK